MSALSDDSCNYFVDFAQRTAPYRFQSSTGPALERAFSAMAHGYADVARAVPLIDRMVGILMPLNADRVRRACGRFVLRKGVQAFQAKVDRFDRTVTPRVRKRAIDNIISLSEVPESDRAFVAEKLERASTVELVRQVELLTR